MLVQYCTAVALKRHEGVNAFNLVVVIVVLNRSGCVDCGDIFFAVYMCQERKRQSPVRRPVVRPAVRLLCDSTAVDPPGDGGLVIPGSGTSAANHHPGRTACYTSLSCFSPAAGLAPTATGDQDLVSGVPVEDLLFKDDIESVSARDHEAAKTARETEDVSGNLLNKSQ